MSEFIAINFSPTSAPDVSLIICTRNRGRKLHQCLNAIEKIQTNHNFELVIIDNNSTDDTFAIIESHARISKFPMRWTKEIKRGVGAARNRGAELARSDILIYSDDDCYPSESFVDQYFSIFTQAPDLGFAGGRVELYDPTDLPITILTSDQERFFAAKERLYAGEIIGANMAIRRSAFNDVNGWDELFGAGTDFPCEDLDMAARILSFGWSGKYDPKPVVYHHHERKTQADAKKLFASYDAGRGGFYGKCLLDKNLRKIYLWRWIKGFRWQPFRITLNELKSLFKYLIKCRLIRIA